MLRLRKAQAAFQSKTLPALVQKSKRKDGLPNLQKLHDALRLKYSISLSAPGRSAAGRTLQLSSEAVQTFTSSVCMRCSFSSVKLRAPVRIEVLARSAVLGVERVLLSTCLDDSQAWGEELASDEHFRFLRSPCGSLLLAVWQDGGLVAGLFATLHYIHVLGPFMEGALAWQFLAGRPEPDDLDSRLGLHDYSVLLTLRSAKVEAFSNCFYKVSALKEDSFGSIRVRRSCTVERGTAVATPGRAPAGGARPGRRAGGGESYSAEVAHFEVIAPHKSGTQPPFPCLRSPQLTFQTLAFKSVLEDALFADITVFDEHGHVFWAASAVVPQQADAPPHESKFAECRFAEVDFDREEPEQGAAVRWICLADRGTAQLVVQLEYGASLPGSASEERPLPRLNAVTWHPELAFLDAWWGSSYAQQKR